MKTCKRCLILFLLLLAASSIYLHLRGEKALATLTITGHSSQKEVEWKLPSSPLQKALLPTHEVLFAFTKEKEVHAFFLGDLIGVRYRVLELRSAFRWFGWKDIVEIEALCSDYLLLEDKQKYPTEILPVEKKRGGKFAAFFRTSWKNIFYSRENSFLMQKAALQVEYFPMRGTKKTFILTYRNGSIVEN
ncbi:MAG: hypothetical protein K2Y01_05385 [Rhabdochlamydiaceae bacterium]|nr:hypothetical protein [Rhabdochlamydiaceae bacterium]